MPETTIVIRTRNEERWLRSVLQRLMEQDYKDFEIIIVDNESKDRTLEIARKFPTQIISLPSSDFTYPRALNLGVEHALGTKYVAIISGHSIPISKTWLSQSLKNFSDPKTAGVYGGQIPLPHSSIWDWLWFIRFSFGGILRFNLPRKEVKTEGGMGVLGFTNAIIRKELWDKHHFNESYANGGEDGEWAGYWLSKGYVIIKDPACVVRHSHNLDKKGWQKQWQYWSSLDKPHPFHRLDYRKDGPHRPV